MNKRKMNDLEKKAKILFIAYAIAIATGGAASIVKALDSSASYISYEELASFLETTDVSVEELIACIDANPNIPDAYKESAKSLVNEHNSKDKDYNFDVFYDNMRTLEAEEFEPDEFKEIVKEEYGYDAAVVAFYDVTENKIYSLNNVKEITKIHELEHVANNWQKKIDGHNYIYDTSVFNSRYIGSSIEEAMDNQAIAGIEEPTSYKINRDVLEFLQNYNNVDYLEYHKIGIGGFIEAFPATSKPLALEIIKELDVIQKMSYKREISTNSQEYIHLLDSCFKLSTQNIDPNNPYLTFANFSFLLENLIQHKALDNSDLLFEYLEKYNEQLQRLGTTNLITGAELKSIITTFKDADCMYLYSDNNVTKSIYPAVSSKKAIVNFDGTQTSCNRSIQEKADVPNFRACLVRNYFRHAKLYGENTFWLYFNDENKLISPMAYRPIPIYYNGQLLTISKPLYIDIQIGKTESGEITFTLKDQEQIILGEETKYRTYAIPLYFYIDAHKYNRYISELHLEEYLNEEYLKAIKPSSYFDNLVYHEESNTFEISLLYWLHITDLDIKGCINRLYYYSIFDSGDLPLNYEYVPLSGVPGLVKGINMIDVLKYFNIFDPEKTEYELTLSELDNLIQTFAYENREEYIDEALIPIDKQNPTL